MKQQGLLLCNAPTLGALPYQHPVLAQEYMQPGAGHKAYTCTPNELLKEAP